MKPLRETLHLGALQRLQSCVRSALHHCQLRCGLFKFCNTDTGQETLYKVNKKIALEPNLLVDIIEAVHRPVFLQPTDLYAFFNSGILATLEHLKIDPDKPDCDLRDLLNTHDMDILSKLITDEILNLPRKYEILVPLMSVELPGEIVEPISSGPDINIFRMNDDLRSKKYPFFSTMTDSGNDDAFPPATDYVYVSLTTYGYGYGGLDSYLYRDFFKRFKVLISAMIVKKILTPESQKQPWEWDIPAEGLWEHFYNETGTSCYFVYDTSQPIEPCYGRFPKLEWQFLRSLKLNDKILEPSEFEKAQLRSMKKVNNARAIRNRLDHEFKGLEPLFRQNSDNIQDLERIFTALDWFFQASVTTNRTFSFIQLAVSLEALLGEHETKKDITERLADRCAFLIRKNPVHRRKVKEEVMEIYKLRSKIIHTGKEYFDDKTEMQY